MEHRHHCNLIRDVANNHITGLCSDNCHDAINNIKSNIEERP